MNFLRATPSILAAWIFGCHKAEKPQIVLAQANQSRLTLEEVRESFPPELEKVLSREQYLAFIQRWIEDEVVYQHALKMNMETDPQIRRKLESLKRKVLIEEFLARDEAAEAAEPDEGAMSRYYESHKEEFRRSVPEFRYLEVRVGSVKDALTLRAQSKGDRFPGETRNAHDPKAEISSLPFRKASDIPACLLRELNESKPGFLSTPIVCPDGAYLIKLVERLDAGTSIPFAEAKDAIASRLSMEQRDGMRADRIRRYKEEAAISFNLDQIPGLETPPEDAQPETMVAVAPMEATRAIPPQAPIVKPPRKPVKSRRRPSPASPVTTPVGEKESAQETPAPVTPTEPDVAATPIAPPEPSPAPEGTDNAPSDTTNR